MLDFNQITSFFCRSLFDKDFKSFLAQNFKDLTKYDPFSSQVVAEDGGIEFGFVNETAELDYADNVILSMGNPIFSFVTIYPKAFQNILGLPFG
jgi:hypothetical protein